jgi:hypothetical protein
LQGGGTQRCAVRRSVYAEAAGLLADYSAPQHVAVPGAGGVAALRAWVGPWVGGTHPRSAS